MHKLDEKVEDVLQHYGIKGMRWDVIRTPEEIAAAGETGGAADSELSDNDDSIFEDIGDVVDAIESKVNDIKDSIKKSGKKLLAGLFGTKPKYNPEYSKKMGKAMKKAQEKKKADSVYDKHKKKRASEYKKHLSKDMKSITKSLESQGYKKHKKNTKTLEERGYKIKAYSNDEASKVISGYKKKGFKKVN